MQAVNNILKTTAGLGLWLVLAACAAAHAETRTTWQEEVLLHDGRKLIVERSQSYGGRHEPGQPAPVREHSITFSLPGNVRSLSWTSEYNPDAGRANFSLVAVHVKEATAYVVAVPNLCLSYNMWGRPNPPYVIFSHDGGQWERIAIETLPIEFKDVNVVVTPGMADAKEMSKLGLISASDVVKRNASFRMAAEFRSILREPLSSQRCPLYPSGPKPPNPIKQ